MTKNAKPELAAAWWRANQPDGLSGAKDLEKALRAYEATLQQLERSGSADDHMACLKAIDALDAAAEKVLADAQKILDARPRDEQHAALMAAEKVRTVAKALKPGAGNEVIAGILAAAENVQAEAEKAAKSAAAGRFSGLAAAADKLQVAIQKALKARPRDDKIKAVGEATERLEKAVREALNSRDSFDGEAYQNTVAAMKALPAKLAEARVEAEDLKEEEKGLFGNPEKYQIYLQSWLKKARSTPLTFAFVAGASSAEHRLMLHRSKDPAVLFAKLKSETGLKKGAFGMVAAHAEDPASLVLEVDTKPLPGLPKKLRLLLKRFKPQPFDRVLVTMEGEEVAEVPDPEDIEQEETLNIEQGAAGAPRRAPEPSPVASGTANREREAGGSAAIPAWQAARASVVEQLKKLGTAIASTKDPEARHAIIMLQAIIKNLTPEPGSQQSVLELERYLTTDDIIDDVESPNPFGLPISVREPLLGALAPLKAELAP